MDKKDLIESIARVCHEANRAFCQITGDNSQPEWKDAPEWQKESARAGVLIHMENNTLTPEESHVNWQMHKIAEGWIYGPVKDVEKKLHPCMKPYSQLPWTQRVKDHIFMGIVKGILNCPQDVSEK